MNEKTLYPSRVPSPVLVIRLTVAALFIWAITSLPKIAIAEDGETLHADNCVACHTAMTGGEGSILYTRVDHGVTSLDALSKQINRCQSSLGLNWSNDQINVVQQYLNASFYKF